jgi:hypothetical protein
MQFHALMISKRPGNTERVFPRFVPKLATWSEICKPTLDTAGAPILSMPACLYSS